MNVGSSEIAFPRHTTSQDKAAKPPKAFLTFQKLGDYKFHFVWKWPKNPDPERREKRIPSAASAATVSDFKIRKKKLK